MVLTFEDFDRHYAHEDKLKQIPNYSIILDHCAPTELRNKLNSINMRLRRLMPEYPDISYLAVASTTNGDAARLVKDKSGKPGRPKEKCEGAKEKPHIHILVVGNGAASLCKSFTSKINKESGKQAAKYRSVKKPGPYFVKYLYEQADMRRSYGSFNWTEIAGAALH